MKHLLWAHSIKKGNGWFRFFGKGFSYKHKNEGLTFSERNGNTKFFKIGGYIISYIN